MIFSLICECCVKRTLLGIDTKFVKFCSDTVTQLQFNMQLGQMKTGINLEVCQRWKQCQGAWWMAHHLGLQMFNQSWTDYVGVLEGSVCFLLECIPERAWSPKRSPTGFIKRVKTCVFESSFSKFLFVFVRQSNFNKNGRIHVWFHCIQLLKNGKKSVTTVCFWSSFHENHILEGCTQKLIWFVET